MAHIAPLALEDVDPAIRDSLAAMEETIGYIPRGQLTMARRPALVEAVGVMLAAVRSGSVERDLKSLVSLAVDIAADCSHTQSHSAFRAASNGIPVEKLHAVYAFEESDMLTAREKAALRLARDGSVVPTRVTSEHFEALREWFDEGEIVELVAVISWRGFLNHWNNIVATQTHPVPAGFAREHLGVVGWEPGKHAWPGTGCRGA